MNDGPTKTSACALVSLVLGLMSLLFFGLLAGVPAVVCGHMSLSNMKKDSLLTGRGMAIAGLITGYIGIAWSLVIIAIMIVMIVTAQSATPFIYNLF